MNVNPIIIAAFEDIAPVYPDYYDGDDENYFVIVYEDERPEHFADDDEIAEGTYVALHYYTPSDPQSIKREIRKRLKKLGFIIQNINTFAEPDTAYRHVVVSALIYSFEEE